MSDINELQRLGPRWYVAHTYSGYENKVKTNLEKIIENRNLGHLIFDIRIPVETVIETNDAGEEKDTEAKLLPGYVFVKMIMNDESWHVVRNIRGVTGFVGPGSKPVPLTEDELAIIDIFYLQGLKYHEALEKSIVTRNLSEATVDRIRRRALRKYSLCEFGK